jgi:hypothetical protein
VLNPSGHAGILLFCSILSESLKKEYLIRIPGSALVSNRAIYLFPLCILAMEK